MARKAPKGPPSEAGIERLLALEAELSARLTAARQEAERIRNEAEAILAAGQGDLQASATAAAEALEVRLSAECARLVERIRADADARVVRIRTLGDETVNALARRVLARVLAPDQGVKAR